MPTSLSPSDQKQPCTYCITPDLLSKNKIGYKLLATAIVIAFVQFCSALEYMMVNPIFISISEDLHIPVSYAGYVTGIYTFSSILSGIISFIYVDRLDKKRSLLVCTFMLSALTLLCSFANSFELLMFLRFISGAFGGVTLGLGLGILLNQTQPQFRGRVISIVVSAFSFVSIIGLPCVIYISNHFSWIWCFRLLSLLCFATFLLVMLVVNHDEKHASEKARLHIDKGTLLACSALGISNFPAFILMPILVPLAIENMHVNLADIPTVFLVGGFCSYFGTKLSGMLCDKYSSINIAIMFSTVFMILLTSLYCELNNAYIFVPTLLFATYGRIVATSTLTSHYPSNEHRAGFNVLQNAATNIFSTLAFIMSAILVGKGSLDLHHIKIIIIISAVVSMLLPLILITVKSRMISRKR